MSEHQSQSNTDGPTNGQATTCYSAGPVVAVPVGPPPLPLHEIESMDSYLQNFGKILGRQAIATLAPLHVPGRDPLPDFDDLLREPFEPQKHVVAAAVQMMDTSGSGFICGAMGTGKTLIGMTSIHQHANRSRRKGGSNGDYRAIVLCPDHLISKWEREIKETIPDATVHRYDDWKGIVSLIGKGHRSRWAKPNGPEYYVVGRNQAKWYPDWLGTTDPYRGFCGRRVETPLSSRNVIVGRSPVVNDAGQPVPDGKGGAKTQTVTARVFACPRCGTVATDRKGLPLSAKDISKEKINCEGKFLRMIAERDRNHQNGKDRLCPIPKEFKDKPVGQEINLGGHRYKIKQCNEPLWCFTSKPYRWAPARIIQKKLRRFFKYLLIDECQESKSEISAQSMAAGKLIASVRHTLALTGTIIGGYADHLFPLLMRLAPETLRSEGFEWGKDLAFSEAYGRIDRIITTKEEGCTTSVGKSVRSMRRAKSGRSSERKAVRPGIMPTLFGRHMIGSSIFITLDEMADELPDLHEYIGGPCPVGVDDPFWIDTCCEMDPTQKTEYARIESILNSTCKELLIRGSMKLLGTMLWTTLGWPDFCYSEWGGDDELGEALSAARLEKAKVPQQADHTVGYWDKPGNRKIENWVGVVTPRMLDKQVIYPKEQALIDICLRHKVAGHQVWVYAQMTQKRNVTPRLKSLLEQHGLKVGIMRSGDVDPKEREDWIAEHGREFDVMICHPKLVSTGLDLFSKVQGGHNYNCLVFYQTGYNLFDMRQAARRAYRIGQPRDCFVYYLYYMGTMQHRAMSLMSKKMAAAHALEGEFSEEGLAAMAGDDNLQMALAKSLAAKIADSDMQRSWTKIKSGEKKERRPMVDMKPLAAETMPILLSPVPIELRLASTPILDDPTKATWTEVKPDTRDLAERFGQAEVGMGVEAPVIAIGTGPAVWYDEATFEDSRAVADAVVCRDESEPIALKLHAPEPDVAGAERDILHDVDLPEFDDALLARMFANLAANGMTLSDLTI
jgi:hypothetical protein